MSTHFTYYFIIQHSVFNLSTASHAYTAGHARFSGTQHKYFHSLAYCRYCGSQKQHTIVGQGSLLFVTYTIIQGIISSEM